MIQNLTNRRDALRALDIGQSVIWAVVAPSPTAEQRLFSDAAAKVGVSITQQVILGVNPKGDEAPLKLILIERTL